MKKSYLFLSLLLTLQLSSALAAASVPATATPTHDIRVLIDVSGSMKKNDPANLRTPALRLLTGLLPSGTQAGVWTFGRYVNMLVPYGAVNTPWRDQAIGAADRINSAGLYTDIEAALDKATWNWTASAPGTKRSIILLTDGLVDVSDSADADRQSRARITDKILPRLQGAGTVVYTIALSNDTDEALLQQLAAATGGGFEQADTADKLERIFFRMFEKAASPNTLPLVDNKVLVDNSIDELTLLVFRKEGAPPTTLTTPDGVAFDQARLPPNARWHNDARYDLVTVEKPMTGTWHVNADIDPDNRVMVVSNLRVVATQLPNQILQGDDHDFFVRFTEKDHAITNKEFLHFLKVNVREIPAAGEMSEQLLLDNGRDGDITAGDGIFSTRLAETMETGSHTITVDVDGTTFKRQHRQDIEVVESPVIADIRADAAGTALFVIPRAGIINPESIEVTATITGNGNLSDMHPLTRTSPSEWQLDLKNYPVEASYQLTFDVEAERLNGKPVSYQSKPLYFGRARATSPAEHTETTLEKPIAGEDAPAEPATDEIIAEETATDTGTEDSDEPARTNWILVISLVVLLNVLMAGGLFLAYRKLFGAPSKVVAASEEAIADEPPVAPVVTAATATTAIHNTQPSVVTQVAEAAAAETTKATTNFSDTSPAPPVQDDTAVEMDVAEQDSSDGVTLEQADTGEVAAEAERAAQGAAGFSPELVMEDTVDEPASDDVDEQLKNLNVDEIDLGFEEKARNTG